jgi:hypothetical protein
MKLTSKEKFLLSNGRNIETIKFCKSLKVPQNHIVWFVDKIEKENFSINSEEVKKNIRLVVKLFSKNIKLKEDLKSLKQAFFHASQFIESDESEKKRILYTFPDKSYIINLTPKELYFEAKFMRNCLNDLTSEVRRKDIAILALKDKSSKTICHLQIGKNGNLEQHYEFANSNISLKTLEYIDEFFEKSEVFEEKLKQNKINKLYDINQYDFDFSVTSKIPFEKKVSLFGEILDDKEFNTVPLKTYNQNSFFENDYKNLNYNEVISTLKEMRDNMIKSFENIITQLEVSKENFFILNDEMHYRIFGKKQTILERFKCIVDFHKEPRKIQAALRPIRPFDETIDAIDEEWGDVEFGEEDIFPVEFEGKEEFVDLSNNRELF